MGRAPGGTDGRHGFHVERVSTFGRCSRTDLPRPAAQPPAPAPVRPQPAAHGWHHGGWSGGPSRAAAWRNWAVTAVIVLTVWVATVIGSGELQYPWPVWVIGPWGAVLLAQTIGRGRRDDDRRRLT